MIQFNETTTYLSLPEFFFTKIPPEPVSMPEIGLFNTPLAHRLGLNIDKGEDLARIFSGNHIIPGTEPLALAYAGHQFGHFTILGDGRAHLLGEINSPEGQLLDLQLKGSGQTPYSRRGDGRAPLGPMLREYIISEAMAGLGIPTTRSLAVVCSGDPVYRESLQPGAILTRVASSHIRVGTFEYAARIPDKGALEALLNYSIKRHYPELESSKNRALDFLTLVSRKQVDLVMQWMGVGFIHGVMNTDNTSISGETIDYGPCAFMDWFDPETVYSSIDDVGRYSYQNQLSIIHWNLSCLAGALLPLIDSDSASAYQKTKDTLEETGRYIDQAYLFNMGSKLGIPHPREEDFSLISGLLKWMDTNRLDFTNTFRALTTLDIPDGDVFQQKEFVHWHRTWMDRLGKNNREKTMAMMRRHNPSVIPRNHLVEQVINKAVEQKDYQPLHHLVEVLQSPYSEKTGLEEFKRPPQPSEEVTRTFCGT